MTDYPVVLIPQGIQSVLSAIPPDPPKPDLPPRPTLKLALRPQPPAAFTKAEPKQTNFAILAAGGAGTVLLAALLGFVGLVIGGLAISTWALWYFQSYGKRLSTFRQAKAEHDKRVAQHKSALKQWEQTIASEKTHHQERVEEWERACRRVEHNYQQQVEQNRTPHAIKAYRNRLVRESLLQTQTYKGTGSSAQKGYAEYSKNCSFGTDLRRTFPDQIHTRLLVGEYGYTPDFAYIDQHTGLHIDIEIDEPYTPRKYSGKGKLKLTHCIDGESGRKDAFRDSLFENCGWVVIRFSEQQVIQSPRSCCKQIALTISELLGDDSVLQAFIDVPDLEKMPRWSKDEANQIALSQARLNYKLKELATHLG